MGLLCDMCLSPTLKLKKDGKTKGVRFKIDGETSDSVHVLIEAGVVNDCSNFKQLW